MKKILLLSLLVSGSLWAGDLEDAEAAYKKGKYTEAFSKYQSSALKGNAEGQYKLAEMYYDGQGVRQNKAEAVKWYKASAELGYIDAQFQMGYLYEHGLHVKQNDAEAAAWYKKVVHSLIKKNS
jgi:TPR repeat protein